MSRSFKQNPVAKLGSEHDVIVRRQAARSSRRIAKMAMRRGDFEGALVARSKLENKWYWPSDGIKWWPVHPDPKLIRK
jgi:hypothetical protein